MTTSIFIVSSCIVLFIVLSLVYYAKTSIELYKIKNMYIENQKLIDDLLKDKLKASEDLCDSYTKVIYTIENALYKNRNELPEEVLAELIKLEKLNI